MLEADHLTYAYAPTDQTYEFTFKVAPGEILAITGPSGSGKSTLLDLIAGFLMPTGGRLNFDGADLLPLPPEKRPVSILFQNDNLFDHLSATQNIALGMPKGERAEQAKIDAVLADVGLAGLGQRPITKLSGGQKQRIALARTLMRDKPVLLLDEPFAALDDKTAEQMRELVAGLVRNRQWTTILVSHQIDDVTRLATNVLRLDNGHLTDA